MKTGKIKPTPARKGEPFLDAGYTTRQSHAAVCTGPFENELTASVDLSVSDDCAPNIKDVLVIWSIDRVTRSANPVRILHADRTPRADISFHSDELEAFATALYEAVRLAKRRGYLPDGGSWAKQQQRTAGVV